MIPMTSADAVAELIARRLLNPDSPDAERRRQALLLLLDRGATLDELEANAHDLGYVAAMIMNGGRPTMTRAELAARCHVPVEVVDRLALAVGLADPGRDVPSANDDDVAMVETFAAAVSLFGQEAALQLARVVGASTARMADAIASSYRTSIARQAIDTDSSGLAMVEANLELEALLPVFMTAVQQLLKRHVAASTRPVSADSLVAYDAASLCVGFVDLVGSTALASHLEPTQLNTALSAFEADACDAVVATGGRVVKLIGDEIMFTHPTADAGLNAARAVLDFVRDHDTLTLGRAGLAFGTVLTRDGDCFGPTVNLAARLVAIAEPGEVVADESTAASMSADVGSRERRVISLKGFDAPVCVVTLSRPDSADHNQVL